jgi:hypothetical protein
MPLAPPPRPVPASVQLHLLASSTTLFGAAFFALTSLMASIFILSTDPIGSYRLSRHRETAPAWLERVEKTGASANDQPIWRHEYTFRLPDGTPMRGVSYSAGEHAAYRDPRLAGPPRPIFAEYVPGDPRTNRLVGTETAMFSPWAIPMGGALPAIGLALFIAGLRRGLRQIHLLAHGDLATGTITSCTLTHSEDKGEPVPFDQFRRDWLGKKAPREAGDLAGDAPPAPQGAWKIRAFSAGFGCVGVGLLILGTLFGLLAAGMILLADEISFNGRKLGPDDRLWPALGFVGFTILYDVVLLIILAGAGPLRRMSGVASGTRPMADAFPEPELDCTIEVALPDGGERVKAREKGLRLGLAKLESATVPILFNPYRPEQVVVLAGPDRPVWVGPDGHLIATASGRRPALQLTLASLGMVGGPLGGLLLKRLVFIE